MTRKLAKTGLSYLSGLMAASFLSITLSLTAGAALAAAGLCARLLHRRSDSRKDIKYPAALCALFCGAGMIVYSCYDILSVRPIQANDGLYFEGSGRVTMAEHYDKSSFYAVNVTLPNGSRGKVSFYLYDGSRLARGDSISFKGTLLLPDSSGFFDTESYLSSRGIFITVSDAEMTGCTVNEGSLSRRADNFRLAAVSRIRRIMAGKSGGELLTGMLFGHDFWKLPMRQQDILTNSGISHVASVSGLHMSIAAGIAAAVCTALGFPKAVKFLCVAAAGTGFAFCADFTMSVDRSLIMILLVYTAELAHRRSDPLTSLTAALLITTAGCPHVIRNISLLLSACGVFGAAVIAPAVTRLIEEHLSSSRDRLSEPYKADGLVSSFLTCVCAYCAVFPVSCLTFDRVSLISPIVNVILSPLFSAAVSLGIIGTLLSAGFLVPLGNIAIRAGGIICQLILGIAGLAGSAKGAVVPTGSGLMPMFTVICIGAGAAGLLLTSKKSYGLLSFSASVFICVCAMSVIRIIPDDSVYIAVITEGKGCAVVISDSSSVHVADFSDSRPCARAVKRYIESSGLHDPSEITVTSDKGAAAYSEFFYDTPLLIPDRSDGYVPGRDVIHGDGIELIPREGCTLMSIDGISAAVVTGKAPLPPDDYGLLVISCSGSGSYDNSDYYAVARTGFTGSVPAGADVVFCESAVYRIKNGVIERKETS